MTCWNASVETNGKEAYQMMREEGGGSYHAFLQGLAERYVREADEFCWTNPELGTVLDKPNLHRSLELYHHTISRFGHTSLIQELVFETAHQPLKRSLSRGNHRHAEASAVQHCLGKDWQASLAILYERLHTHDQDERMAACKGLCILLLGREHSALKAERNDFRLQTLYQYIEKCFSAPLLELPRTNGNVNLALVGRVVRWTTNCEGPSPHEDVGSRVAARLQALMRPARKTLFIHSGSFGKKAQDFKIRWKAKRIRSSSRTGEAPVRSHEVLQYGTVVQVLLTKGDEQSILVQPHGNGKNIIGIFLVCGFIEGNEQGPWAVCIRFERSGKDVMSTPKEMRSTNMQLIQLNEGVLRIGIYHMCNYHRSCEIDSEFRMLKHGETTLSGGTFRIQTRSQVYPPRVA